MNFILTESACLFTQARHFWRYSGLILFVDVIVRDEMSFPPQHHFWNDKKDNAVTQKGRRSSWNRCGNRRNGRKRHTGGRVVTHFTATLWNQVWGGWGVLPRQSLKMRSRSLSLQASPSSSSPRPSFCLCRPSPWTLCRPSSPWTLPKGVQKWTGSLIVSPLSQR